MSSGNLIHYPATFTSGATSSAEVDIGPSAREVFIDLPSATTFNLNFQAAHTTGGDFKRIYHGVSDGDAVVTTVEITSATAGTNGAIVPIPAFARFMKIEALTAVANGATYGFFVRD